MRRYLLVDDNREFAENLAEIVAEAGAACEIAGSGAEALERVRTGRFDAVVTDMRMPGMGGAAVVHAVRRTDPGLPAVVLTAHAGDADRLGPVRPLAAIVDLRMPGGPDGEAARLLAARFPGLPVLEVTAHPDAAPPGVRAVFPKPFDPGALMAAIEGLHAGRSDPS